MARLTPEEEREAQRILAELREENRESRIAVYSVAFRAARYHGRK